MADKNQQLTIVEQFEDSTIRKVWHQDEWWYSLVDVMSVFAGTNRACKYWYDLKKRLISDNQYEDLSVKIALLKSRRLTTSITVQMQ